MVPNQFKISSTTVFQQAKIIKSWRIFQNLFEASSQRCYDNEVPDIEIPDIEVRTLRYQTLQKTLRSQTLEIITNLSLLT